MRSPVPAADRLRRLAAKATIAWLLLLGAWLGCSGNAVAAEVIHYFDSSVSVAKDGELTVVEAVRVQAEGREIRHGIYRDFPLTFKDAGGTVREVTFSVSSVTRDGRPEPYFTERRNNFIRIYAGNKDTIVPRGEHTYVFHYRTGRQIRWFDGKAELNWNVTGNFWRFPIDMATYRLQLVEGERPTRWTAFSGPSGARGTDWRGAIDGSGVLTVKTTQRLAPGEGLTVVVALPAGAVEPPSPNSELWWKLFDNRRWIFAGVGFVLVLLYYTASWIAIGRDPRGGAIIPLFHPPKGISPALANYIHNWGLTREKWRAFTAAALSLAVRGLIRFDQSGDTLRLRSTGKQLAGGFSALPAGEGAIFSWVNLGGNVTIDKSHGHDVARVGKKFAESIEAENRNRFFRRNLGYVVVGLVLTVAVVVGLLAFGGVQDEDIIIMFFMLVVGFIAGAVLLPFLQTLFSGAGFVAVFRSAMSLIFIAIFFAFSTDFLRAFFPDGFSHVLPEAWSFLSGYPFPFVLVGAFAALNGLFVHLMRAPTALGRPVMDQLDGFKLYLETAESGRLNMQAPEITAERFEALLPYAVALDVEKPWADAFAAALRRAHPDDPEPIRHYRPTWGSGGNFSSGDFGRSVASSMSSLSSALASAVPVSSGSSGFSSGGGGSGGGGGGGGGGGW